MSEEKRSNWTAAPVKNAFDPTMTGDYRDFVPGPGEPHPGQNYKRVVIQPPPQDQIMQATAAHGDFIPATASAAAASVPVPPPTIADLPKVRRRVRKPSVEPPVEPTVA